MNNSKLNNVSSLRTIAHSLIKTDEYILNAKQIVDNNEKTEAVIFNQNSILMKVLETAADYNKWKKTYLNKFLDSYIKNLSITEDFELVWKLYYYLSVYELNWLWWSDKLDYQIVISPNEFSKKEIMIELLLNCVYLPEYENQNQFNQEMLKLLPRLEKRINTFRLWQKPLIFTSVNPRALLSYMEDTNSINIKWVKHLDKWIIKKVWYNFALNEKKDLWEDNEFYMSVLINLDYENSFSSEEYKRHLAQDLKKKDFWDWKNFYYTEDSLFRYSLYIWEEFYTWDMEDLDEEWFSKRAEKSAFEFRIYAHSKKDLDPEESFSNVCYRLPALTEQIVSDVYETYWRDSRWDIWFPSKPQVFDISKIINAQEMHDWYIDDIDDNYKQNNWKELNSTKNYKFYKPEEIEYNLDDLILEDKIIEPLYDLLDYFKNIKFYIENNWILPWGMILSGPPWTWKTTLVQVLWKESWAWVFVANAAQEESYVWDSAKNIEKIIDDAEKYVDTTWNPSIIFFDEADTIFSSRWWDVKDFKEWMLSVILQKMDWFNKKYQWKITFAFGTNRDDLFDKALLSRIDKHLVLDLPSEKSLEKILDLHIRKKMNWIKILMYEKADLDLEFLSKKLKWKSGRFVKNLISNAHNRAIRLYIKNNDFVMTNDLILSFIDTIENQEEKIDKKMWFIK